MGFKTEADVENTKQPEKTGLLKAAGDFVKNQLNSEVFNLAKRTSLLGFLDENHIGYFKQGKGHASRYCPSCGESSAQSNKCNINNELWKCWGCGKGGDVISYAEYLWGLNSLDAAKELAEGRYPLFDFKKAEEMKKLEPELDYTQFYASLQKHGLKYAEGPWQYLTGTNKEKGERGIPEKVLKEAVERGIVRFLPGSVGENAKFLEKTFGRVMLEDLQLWKPGAKIPWVSYRPIIFLLPSFKSAEWRLAKKPEKATDKKSMRIGLDKSCYIWEGKDSSKVSVVEGVIDMLSMVALGWEGDIKALPGTGVWDGKFIDGYSRALFSLDNDVAGKAVTANMEEYATEKSIVYTTKHPPAGDVNEQWLEKIRAA